MPISSSMAVQSLVLALKPSLARCLCLCVHNKLMTCLQSPAFLH